MMLVMAGSDAAPGAMILFAPRDLVVCLPPDSAVVGSRPYWVTVWSGSPRLENSLYAAGAWIVVPAGLRGRVHLTEHAGSGGSCTVLSGPPSH